MKLGEILLHPTRSNSLGLSVQLHKLTNLVVPLKELLITKNFLNQNYSIFINISKIWLQGKCHVHKRCCKIENSYELTNSITYILNIQTTISYTHEYSHLFSFPLQELQNFKPYYQLKNFCQLVLRIHERTFYRYIYETLCNPTNLREVKKESSCGIQLLNNQNATNVWRNEHRS